MKRTFVIIALLEALACAAGENLCPNGGFEEGAKGWILRDPSFHVEKGVGVGGSAALVFEAKTWKKHTSPCCEIAAKPGRVYGFSGRIRYAGFTNSVTIALVRLTKSRGWITQVNASPMNENAVDGDGWLSFEGQTDYLDEKSQILRLYFDFRQGACGRFLVDDLRIWELPEDSLGGLLSSAYRDAAAGGPVRFAVPVHVNPGERKPEDLRCTLAYRDATGAKREAAMAIGGAAARATLDVAAFAPGTQTLVATLADATGATLDTATLAFTRLKAEPDYPVRVDTHRRFIVNGRPFFPICITWGMSIPKRDWPTAMAKFGKGPFNLAMVYEDELTMKDLDFFRANGLMVKYNLKDVYSGFSKINPPKGVKTEADEIRYVTEKVNLLKDHPAIFDWYINDEFPITMAGRVKRRYEFLLRLDPTHPVSICLDRPRTIGSFLGGFDIVGSDPYPVRLTSPLHETAQWTRLTDEKVLGLKPLMQTVQAFDWAWFPGWKSVRFPTYDEMRAMTWQQIAEGATGIGYFSYSCIYANLRGEAFDRAWGDTKRVAQEVKDLSSVLLSVAPAPKVIAAPKALSLRVWRHQGDVYLVACDLTGRASTPQVRLEGAYAAATCRPGAEVTLAPDGTFALKLPPYGVAIVRAVSR